MGLETCEPEGPRWQRMPRAPDHQPEAKIFIPYSRMLVSNKFDLAAPIGSDLTSFALLFACIAEVVEASR